MSYSFRIRFSRSASDTIQGDVFELHVPVRGECASVVLRSLRSGQELKDAEELTLEGSGFPTDKAAAEAGLRFQMALMVALARARVGADFGKHPPKGTYTEYGLNWLEEKMGQRVLNDSHGLMVFSTDPKPMFLSSEVRMTRGVNAETFRTLLSESIATRPDLSERDQLAFNLFNSSFFQPTSDIRFLLLIMAIEALIEPSPRSPEGQAHVRQLIAQTKEAGISSVEKDSMIGSIRRLLEESIGQAGRRMVSDRLGIRRYGGTSAEEYFTYCYGLRSKLVHGSLPYPTFEEVSKECGLLECLVSDLLTSKFLALPT